MQAALYPTLTTCVISWAQIDSAFDSLTVLPGNRLPWQLAVLIDNRKRSTAWWPCGSRSIPRFRVR